MYIRLSKKFFFILLAVILFLSLVFALPSALVSTPNYAYTIVIDAGHGGIDGGSVGISTGVDENSLNLDYALTLEKIMQKYNVKVVLTRRNLNGLYSQFSENKKLDDMDKRNEIIEENKADLVISLHMNSFPLTSCKGAQVFFKKDDIFSETLANSIQSIFIQTLPNAKTFTLVGDYYLLNTSKVPTVIIECGYLSNREEEQLLIKDDYKNLVCYSVFIGILKYLAL